MTVPSTWYPVKSSSCGGNSLFEGVEKPAQDPAHFMRTFKKFCCLGFSKVISPLCNKNLSFEFCQGSNRVPKQVTKLAATEMRFSFRDVTRDRDGCAPHLIGQTIGFSLGKSFSRIVEPGDQVHCLLPGDQVFVMPCHCSSAYRQRR